MKPKHKKILAKEVLIFWTLPVVNIIALAGISLYNYYIGSQLEKINQATAAEVGKYLHQEEILNLLAIISIVWLALIYPLRGIFLSIKWALYTVRN